MPAAYAHEMTALRSLELTQGAPALTEAERRVFLLGAQGPDMLYYHGTLPPWRSHKPNQIGLRLHAVGAAPLLREMIARAKTGIESALTLGMLSHWAADGTAHPYVLARSGEQRNAHGLIEMGADTLYFQRDGGKGAPRHMPYIKAITRAELLDASAFLAQSVNASLEGTSLTARQAYNALRDGDRLYGLFYSPDGRRFRLFRRLESLVGQRTEVTCHMPPVAPEIDDPRNLAHRPWGTEGRTESYDELLSQAAETGAQYFALALAFWRGELPLDEALAPMGNRRMDGR